MKLAEDGDTPDDASDDKVDEAWEDDIPRRNSTSQNMSQSQKSEASSSASSNERDGKVRKVRKSATLVGLGVNKKVDSDAMELAAEKSDKVMRLDIRQVEASIFIIVDEVTNKAAPGYCLVNKSVSHLIHYRQKNARGSNWRTILPGDSVNYTWEDLFIGRQLMVQAGRNILTPLSKAQTDSNFPGLNPHLLGRSAPTMTKRNNDDKRLEGLTECMKCLPSFGQTAERYTLITLDDVDTRSHEIPLPHGTTGTLIGEISILGTVKTLTIRPFHGHDNDTFIPSRALLTRELLYCHMFCEKQLQFLSKAFGQLSQAMDAHDRETRMRRRIISTSSSDSDSESGSTAYDNEMRPSPPSGHRERAICDTGAD